VRTTAGLAVSLGSSRSSPLANLLLESGILNIPLKSLQIFCPKQQVPKKQTKKTKVEKKKAKKLVLYKELISGKLT